MTIHKETSTRRDVTVKSLNNDLSNNDLHLDRQMEQEIDKSQRASESKNTMSKRNSRKQNGKGKKLIATQKYSKTDSSIEQTIANLTNLIVNHVPSSLIEYHRKQNLTLGAKDVQPKRYTLPLWIGVSAKQIVSFALTMANDLQGSRNFDYIWTMVRFEQTNTNIKTSESFAYVVNALANACLIVVYFPMFYIENIGKGVANENTLAHLEGFETFQGTINLIKFIRSAENFDLFGVGNLIINSTLKCEKELYDLNPELLHKMRNDPKFYREQYFLAISLLKKAGDYLGFSLVPISVNTTQPEGVGLLGETLFLEEREKTNQNDEIAVAVFGNERSTVERFSFSTTYNCRIENTAMQQRPHTYQPFKDMFGEIQCVHPICISSFEPVQRVLTSRNFFSVSTESSNVTIDNEFASRAGTVVQHSYNGELLKHECNNFIGYLPKNMVLDDNYDGSFETEDSSPSPPDPYSPLNSDSKDTQNLKTKIGKFLRGVQKISNNPNAIRAARRFGRKAIFRSIPLVGTVASLVEAYETIRDTDSESTCINKLNSHSITNSE